MSFTPLRRALVSRRRSRARAEADLLERSRGGDVHRRDPAVARLNVSPVHGRHCICERCTLYAPGPA